MNPYRHRDGRDHFDHVPKSQQQSDPKGLPEIRRSEELDIVPKTDELRDVGTIPAIEAMKDAAGGRVVLKQGDENERRDNEEVDLPMMLNLFPADLLCLHQPLVARVRLDALCFHRAADIIQRFSLYR